MLGSEFIARVGLYTGGLNLPNRCRQLRQSLGALMDERRRVRAALDDVEHSESLARRLRARSLLLLACALQLGELHEPASGLKGSRPNTGQDGLATVALFVDNSKSIGVLLFAIDYPHTNICLRAVLRSRLRAVNLRIAILLRF